MGNARRRKGAIALSDIKKFFFAVFVFRDQNSVAAGNHVVFVELGMRMITAYLALINELEIELDNGFVGIKGENAPASVADAVEIALRVDFPDFHAYVPRSRSVTLSLPQ